MAQGLGGALDEKICTNMICHYGKAGVPPVSTSDLCLRSTQFDFCYHRLVPAYY